MQDKYLEIDYFKIIHTSVLLGKSSQPYLSVFGLLRESVLEI